MVDRLAVTALRILPRNPGPEWGFRFLHWFQGLPRWMARPVLVLGTWIAVVRMPEQREHSRDFLGQVYGRRAGWRDVWRHFYAYLEFLLLRLRVGAGAPATCTLDPENAECFESLMRSGEQALFGTFHYGHSDLLGFALTTRGRRVAMIRLRVGNSDDTQMLQQQFGGAVTFIWVNEPENLLFAMKSAIDRGESLAMQCDRLYSSRTEAFEFLGARRMFPFTIYHLAVLFNRPVIFCFGLPDGVDATRVAASPLFRPDPAQDRAANLARARVHFQTILRRLEGLVRERPTLWFNFIALNPVAPNAAGA